VLALPAAGFAMVFAVVLVLDQLTKQLVRTFLDPPGTTVHIIGSLLQFTHVRNPGASFGMLPGHTPVFMAITLLVLVGVAIYWFRVRPRRTVLVTALALVSAGAVGNLIDRALTGLVTDFIQIPLDFPVFNVADMAIVSGVSLLMWWVLFGPAEHSAAVGVTGPESVVPGAAMPEPPSLPGPGGE
jgi:signal peptidase II